MFGELIQEVLEGELDTELGYDKNRLRPKDSGSRRNGHTKKRVRSEHGEIELTVPRDYTGEFEPVIVKKHQRESSGIEEQILALYAKGVSVRDIQAHLNQLYGVDVSPTLISNVTNRIMPVIKEWQSRPLQKTYAVVFLDAIHYKVKQEGHIVNKPVYTAPSEEAALALLDDFEEIWGSKYPLVVRLWRRNWGELATFFKYPPEIRKLIYTTESYHRKLRKVIKGKAVFPCDEALLKMLYLVTQDVILKWTGRIHNWGQILLQLSIFFPDRVSSFLR